RPHPSRAPPRPPPSFPTRRSSDLDPNDLNPQNLAKYDAVLLYANHDSATPAQAQALLDFVRSGKGFIPIHSASHCFRNSAEFIRDRKSTRLNSSHVATSYAVFCLT